MYHKVGAGYREDPLSIDTGRLTEQFQILNGEGYTSVFASTLIAHHYTGEPLPPKPVVLSFDDGYRDNFTTLYPLLKQYGMKAVIFLVPSFIREDDDDEKNRSKYLTLTDIRKMDSRIIEFGLHAFRHDNYRELSASRIAGDLDDCFSFFSRVNIPHVPALAYPYGASPRKNKAQYAAMTRVFRDKKLQMAFRIGNRLNPLPLNDPFVVERIDIKGTESPAMFKRKLRYGGKYLFF
jgi:peptidoglycan/xylan/chitin deacetylase (PgdA/CDA1 family)